MAGEQMINWSGIHTSSETLTDLHNLLIEKSSEAALRNWLKQNEKLVRQHFANPEFSDSHKQIFESSLKYNDSERNQILEILLEYGFPKARDILLEYCLDKDVAMVRNLLEHGWDAADIQYETAADSTPEIRAIIDKHIFDTGSH